jgi:tetratricopeptide (TPR) repeat protein
LLVFRGQHRRAVALLDERAAVAVKEGDLQRTGSYLYWKAEALFGSGDVAASRDAIAQARSLDPERLMFFLYLSLGDLDRAAADAAWRSPAYLAAGRAAKNANVESAIAQYEMLVNRDPLTEAFALFQLATLHMRNGEPRRAIRHLRLLQSRVPSGLAELSLQLVSSYHVLGQAYERSGDPAAALEAYRRVLKMWRDADPDLPDFIETRARVAELERDAGTAMSTSARP